MNSLSEVLKNLALDTWYKVLMALSAIILVGALFIEVKGILVTNGQLQLIAAGSFLIGLGEWPNYRRTNRTTSGSVQLRALIRKPTLLGTTLQVLGFILVAAGVANAFGATIPRP